MVSNGRDVGVEEEGRGWGGRTDERKDGRDERKEGGRL